jgi:hypothetical protein
MSQAITLPPEVQRLARLVARKHQVDYIMLVGIEPQPGMPRRDVREKTDELVSARRELVCTIKATWNWSASRIGRVLRMNHTSILAYLKPPRPRRAKPSFDFSEPDESGVWAI